MARTLIKREKAYLEGKKAELGYLVDGIIRHVSGG
jgi:hypothetical protein